MIHPQVCWDLVSVLSSPVDETSYLPPSLCAHLWPPESHPLGTLYFPGKKEVHISIKKSVTNGNWVKSKVLLEFGYNKQFSNPAPSQIPMGF